jgi:hypothetical protein
MKHDWILCSNLLLAIALSGCSSLPVAEVPESADVPVFLAGTAQTNGIGVSVRSPVYTSGTNAGLVQITVANLLEEEVFLEVTGFDDLGYTIESTDPDEIYYTGGGGSITVFPDNTHMLKRLHGSTRMKDGSLATCGCAVAFIRGKVNFGPPDVDVPTETKVTITIPIAGYLRSNGKHFWGSVEVPIETREGQQEN